MAPSHRCCDHGGADPRLGLFNVRSLFVLVPRNPGTLPKSQSQENASKTVIEQGRLSARGDKPTGKARLGCEGQSRNTKDDCQREAMQQQESFTETVQACPRNGAEENGLRGCRESGGYMPPWRRFA